ncbi:MAG: ComF family protein [Propionibacteriaceae bacterium]|nr:ComF family protein [Propionibacteriaceae bacterium]
MPRVSAVDGLPVVAGGAYRGVLRAVILTAKERHGLGLLPELAAVLARAVGEYPGDLLLVPVPTAPARIRERGVDLPLDVALLSARMLRRSGRRVRVVRGLRLRRVPADQARLSAAARSENVAGAMRWAPKFCPDSAIIVDDLVTTGSTLREAVRACAECGVPVRGAACLARPAR